MVDPVTLTIAGHTVTFYKAFDQDGSVFRGQKLLHPFGTQTKNVVPKPHAVPKVAGKRARRYQPPRSAKPIYTREMTEDLTQVKFFSVKFDGACGLLHYNTETQTFEPWTRYDVKQSDDGSFKDVDPSWIPCEPKPTDPKATHWPHFRPCDPRKDPWQIQAFDQIKGQLNKFFEKDITVEYVGKKFNDNPQQNANTKYGIVFHNSMYFDIPFELRNYNGFLEFFKQIPFIEGLVAYTDTKCYKIRREMFDGLSWGKTEWKDMDQTLEGWKLIVDKKSLVAQLLENPFCVDYQRLIYDYLNKCRAEQEQNQEDLPENSRFCCVEEVEPESVETRRSGYIEEVEE